jgi:Flp pilus assembly pilin Flp
MSRVLHKAVSDDSGQDIAEYAVMAAVMITVVLGILALVGVNASQVFFQVQHALH